jgi:GT2 family glycosyltransferase
MGDDARVAARVAVVVVNYNSARFIDEFCASLEQVVDPPWRLVVVDSGSTDNSLRTIEAAFPDAKIIRAGENIGFAAGCNVAVAACGELGVTHALFLNNDVKVTPDFLRNLMANAGERRIVVPKILYYDDPRLISTHAGGFDWTLGVFRDTFGGKPDGPATNAPREDLETASFCCALVPLAAFGDAGPLDERFFMYYEETDFLRRAREHGYTVRYEPSAVILHHESGASGGGWMTPFKQYYATRNRLYLVRKHSRSRLRYAFFTAYFWATRVVTAARMIARRETRLLRAMLLGATDYYRGRMGRTRQVADL